MGDLRNEWVLHSLYYAVVFSTRRRVTEMFSYTSPFVSHYSNGNCSKKKKKSLTGGKIEPITCKGQWFNGSYRTGLVKWLDFAVANCSAFRRGREAGP